MEKLKLLSMVKAAVSHGLQGMVSTVEKSVVEKFYEAKKALFRMFLELKLLTFGSLFMVAGLLGMMWVLLEPFAFFSALFALGLVLIVLCLFIIKFE